MTQAPDLNDVLRRDLVATYIDLLMSLAQGNPGAVTALSTAARDAPEIDRSLNPFGFLDVLESLNIRGPKIWVLWKDVCKGDVEKFLAVLRAHQLVVPPDFVSLKRLDPNLLDGRHHKPSIDPDECLSLVQDELAKSGISFGRDG